MKSLKLALDDELYAQLKVLAHASDIKLASFVEDLIASGVSRVSASKGANDTQASVDQAQVLAAMEKLNQLAGHGPE